MLGNVIQSVQKVLKHQDSSEDLGWLDTLAGMTDLDSLIAIKEQLSKMDFFYPKHLKNKIDLVLDVDENSYRRVKRVTYNYLIKLKNNKSLKSDTQVVMYEYHRQLYASYSQILDAYKAQVKVKLAPEQINLVLARYLNAAFMMSKWRYFDDQPAPFGVWDNVHKVIRIAEELAIMNKNLFLYSYQIKETSIATILKRGFMVDTLHKGNYSQLEIELTDRILKIWSTNPLIVNTFKPNRYHFFIQLEDGKGPERLRVQERFANCRYWKTTRLIDLMEAYLCAVDMQKPLREFGLEKVARASVIVKLFKKLRIDWCVEGYARQRRSEKRNQKNSLINVSYGIGTIHHRLMAKQAQQKEKESERGGFTFDLKVATHDINQTHSIRSTTHVVGDENWWMVDESKSGFAVDFGSEPASWAEIGLLVGYTEMGYKNAFNIAEIKSVRKLANGTYRAGFKKISYNVAAVRLSLMEKTTFSQPVEGYYLDDGQDNVSYSADFPGFLVDNDASLMPKLLISRNQFKRGKTYHLNIDGDNHLIRAGKVINKQRDWILFEALL
jgi:cyclic-di-GMP-binding protein